MTYYERIQQAIDYIEENLGADITVDEAAQNAFLSVSHFYRLFPEFTGYSYKEYVRKRRLSESLEAVGYSCESIYDIALDSGFNALEAYTRAFRKEFGINPSELRKIAGRTGGLDAKGLGPIRLITEFYDNVVLKYLEQTSVISNTAVSTDPERDAWRPLEKWARREQRLKKPYRIIGFENPPPPQHKRIDDEGYAYFTPVPGVAYGYEYWLTVDDATIPSEGLSMKSISAGLFAVMSAASTDYTVEWKGRAWAKMRRVLATTEYSIKQYDLGPRMFEEHVQHFPKDDVVRFDLYIEIE
jgi:AraC family transcriptional regulator